MLSIPTSRFRAALGLGIGVLMGCGILGGLQARTSESRSTEKTLAAEIPGAETPAIEIPATETRAAKRSSAAPGQVANKVTCLADISYPLEVRIDAGSPVAPGALVQARVQVLSRDASPVSFERVEVEFVPSDQLTLLGSDRHELGALRPGQVSVVDLAVRIPNDSGRRTLEARVRAWSDGDLYTTAGVLNLLPGGSEVSRDVVRSDGQKIREVAARRID